MEEEVKKEKIDIKKELLLTLSNQKSLFSSKKLERAVVFYVFVTISIIYVFLNIKELETFDFLQIVAVWLAYGGYNTYQNYKDKKLFTEEREREDI